MSGKTKEFNAYSITLEITSTENFYLARSSNGFDVYGLYMTGEGAACCTCPGAVAGYSCKHRKALLARFVYTTPLDEVIDNETWAAIQGRIEAIAEREAVEELFNAA
jgi:uncharacterized Zn finger protein